MKVHNSNSFLDAAKKSQRTSIFKVMSSGETVTPMMPGYKTRLEINGRTVVRPTYFKFLRDFSSGFKTKKSISDFQDRVVAYLQITDQKVDAAAYYKLFSEHVRGLRAATNLDVTFKLRAAEKVDLNKYTAQQLYVMYWTDRILHEHNERVDATYKLQEQYPAERNYSPSKVDIARFDYDTGRLSRIQTSDLYKYMEDARKLHVRSREDFYTYDPVISKEKLDLIYEHTKHGHGAADKFENRYDLFFHNLLYAAEEAGWDEAIDLIKWFIETGHGDALYDLYTADGNEDFAVVFEYGDSVDEMSTKQKNFVDAMTELIDTIIRKENIK